MGDDDEDGAVLYTRATLGWRRSRRSFRTCAGERSGRTRLGRGRRTRRALRHPRLNSRSCTDERSYRILPRRPTTSSTGSTITATKLSIVRRRDVAFTGLSCYTLPLLRALPTARPRSLPPRRSKEEAVSCESACLIGRICTSLVEAVVLSIREIFKTGACFNTLT